MIRVDDVVTDTIGITDDEKANVSDGSDSALDTATFPEDWINARVVVSKPAVDIVLSLSELEASAKLLGITLAVSMSELGI